MIVTAKAPSKVAHYIATQIALSDKSQKQIAEECGFLKPNILSMIKTGATKLPMEKVYPLAVSLGIDPKELFRRTCQEYLPDLWKMFEKVYGKEASVSDAELAFCQRFRKATGGELPDLGDPQVGAILDTAFKEAAALTKKRNSKVLHAYNEAPRNNKGAIRSLGIDPS